MPVRPLFRPYAITPRGVAGNTHPRPTGPPRPPLEPDGAAPRGSAGKRAEPRPPGGKDALDGGINEGAMTGSRSGPVLLG